MKQAAVRDEGAPRRVTRLGAAPLAALFAAGAMAADTPAGWMFGGPPEQYAVATDAAEHHGGKASAMIWSTAEAPEGFASLTQSALPDAWLGQRVRFSAWVKWKGVANWAGLWMRVDGKEGKPTAFDNMAQRAIKGTGDWKRHEIVLDVAADTKGVCFGLLLAGAGTLWLDDVKFEVVDKTVPTTDTMPREERANAEPRNLDFEAPSEPDPAAPKAPF